MWRAIRDQSGSDLSTHGPQGKQNNVSTSPNTLGVHLPLLQAPSGVLSSPQPSVSSSVKWGQHLTSKVCGEDLGEMEAYP